MSDLPGRGDTRVSRRGRGSRGGRAPAVLLPLVRLGPAWLHPLPDHQPCAPVGQSREPHQLESGSLAPVGASVCWKGPHPRLSLRAWVLVQGPRARTGWACPLLPRVGLGDVSSLPCRVPWSDPMPRMQGPALSPSWQPPATPGTLVGHGAPRAMILDSCLALPALDQIRGQGGHS